MNDMGNWMKPKAPIPQPTPEPVKTPPPPAPLPTMDEAQESQVEGDRRLRRRGRAATILTSQAGDTGGVRTATKTLLGA